MFHSFCNSLTNAKHSENVTNTDDPARKNFAYVWYRLKLEVQIVEEKQYQL